MLLFRRESVANTASDRRRCGYSNRPDKTWNVILRLGPRHISASIIADACVNNFGVNPLIPNRRFWDDPFKL